MNAQQLKTIELNAISKLLLGFRKRYLPLLKRISQMKTYNIPEYNFLLILKKKILYLLQNYPNLQETFDRLDSLVFKYDRLYDLSIYNLEEVI